MNELRVISGIHRGISLPMDTDTLVIGSGFDADLMLSDPGVAEQHLTLEVSDRLPPECWKVTLDHQDVWDSKGKRLSDEYVLKRSVALNVGGVWVAVSGNSDPWPSGDIAFVGMTTNNDKTKKSPGQLVNIGGITVGILLGALSFSFAGGNSESKRSLDTPTNAEGTASNTSSSTSNTSNDVNHRNPVDPLLLFEKMLKERRLRGVTINLDEDTLFVSGELTKKDLAILKRMTIRFDQHDTGVNVENHVVEALPGLPFKIVKVVSGPYAYIEAEDGSKIAIGDQYQGFKLVSIEKEFLRFSGRRNVELKW